MAKLVSPSSKTLSPRHARLIRESGNTEQQLRYLCECASSGDGSAIIALHKLVSKAPALRQVLTSFAEGATVRNESTQGTRRKRSKIKRPKIRGNWQGIVERGGGWVRVFSGGLPSLGKRK